MAGLGKRWLEGLSWNRVGPPGRGPGFGGEVIERDHGLWAAGECAGGGGVQDRKRHVINHPNTD